MYVFIEVTIDASGTSRNIRQLMAERNITVSELTRCIGVRDSTLRRWRSGTSVPNLNDALTLAALFDLPVESIIVYHKTTT